MARNFGLRETADIIENDRFKGQKHSVENVIPAFKEASVPLSRNV